MISNSIKLTESLKNAILLLPRETILIITIIYHITVNIIFFIEFQIIPEITTILKSSIKKRLNIFILLQYK